MKLKYTEEAAGLRSYGDPPNGILVLAAGNGDDIPPGCFIDSQFEPGPDPQGQAVGAFPYDDGIPPPDRATRVEVAEVVAALENLSTATVLVEMITMTVKASTMLLDVGSHPQSFTMVGRFIEFGGEVVEKVGHRIAGEPDWLREIDEMRRRLG